jgi:selenocysteine lyase/cysteine desulfurase
MMERRDFLRLTGAGAAGLLTSSAASHANSSPGLTVAELETELAARTGNDDEFWRGIRTFYSAPTDYIDLDHANTAPTPQPVFNAFVERARWLSHAPAERFGKMWFEELHAVVRPAVASYLGVDPQKLAFMANTTTALNTVLHGFPLRPGDEILVTDHEYPDMVETILQRVQRDGVAMRTVRVPLPGDDGTLPGRVAESITERTKLLLISHISAWSGEIFPVAEVTAVARSRGVAVLVDAAQSVGIIDVNFDALGCDFLGASFHKGLGAPLPTGVLTMRPERVEEVLPLHPPSWYEEVPDGQIRVVGHVQYGGAGKRVGRSEVPACAWCRAEARTSAPSGRVLAK